jgi:4-amino-4-deoxy-L-arabinose transferase-like glycosyltransferase
MAECPVERDSTDQGQGHVVPPDARLGRAALLRWLDHPRAPHAIVGAGLVVRLVVLALVARTPLQGDALSYHETALSLASGVPYEPHWPPGLPALLAIAFGIFGASEIVARAVMLPVYVAFSGALFVAGRRFGGERAANVALAVFALSPAIVWNSVTPLTQLAAAALTLGAVHFAARLQEGKRPLADAALLGLFLAVLLLTRPSNMLLAATLPAYLALRTRRWQALAVPALVIVLGVGLWSLKAHAMTGRFVLVNSANSQNVFYGNNPWTPNYRTWWYGSHKDPSDPTVAPEFLEALAKIHAHPVGERDRLFTRAAIEHIEDRPDLFVIRTLSRVRTFLAFDTFAGAQLARSHRLLSLGVSAVDALCFLSVGIAAIFFPAALRARRDPAGAPGREAIMIALLVALLLSVPYFFTLSHPTFHTPLVAVASLLAVVTAASVLEVGPGPIWRALSRRGRFATAAVFAAFLAIQAEWAIHLFSRAQ